MGRKPEGLAALRQMFLLAFFVAQVAVIFAADLQPTTATVTHSPAAQEKLTRQRTNRIYSLMDHCIRVTIFTFLSATFAGLTIGIMCMDTFTLEIISQSGPEPDRTYASHILPIRRQGHHTLCTLIISNMLLNVLIVQEIGRVSDLMDAIRRVGHPQAAVRNTGNALYNFIASTAAIMIFTEVIPMSICRSKHSLRIAAAGLGFVQVAMVVTFPVAVPLGWLLDWLVPHDVGQIYDRNELKKLMRMHYEQHSEKSGLARTEVKLLIAAMNFHEQSVKEVMTPIEKIVSVRSEDLITSELLERLWTAGRSRMPVLASSGTYAGVIFLKDLITVNLATDQPQTIAEFMHLYARPFAIMKESTSLPEMLHFFQKGRTHIALVYRDDEEEPESVAEGDAVPAAATDGDESGIEVAKSGSAELRVQRDSTTLALPKATKPSPGITTNHSMASVDDEVEMRATVRKSATFGSRRRPVLHQGIVVGVATLEDVVEKLIEDEIYDEYDHRGGADNHRQLRGIPVRRGRGFAHAGMVPPPAMEPRHPPRVNFSSYYVRQEEDVPLSNEQVWAVAYFLVRYAKCFCFWRPGYVKLLLDECGDLQLRPNPLPLPGDPSRSSSCAISSSMILSPSSRSTNTFPLTEEARAAHLDFIAEADEPSHVLYEKDKPSAVCTLVLNGMVEMLVGKERFPKRLYSFNLLAEEALTLPFYTPDYTAIARQPVRLYRISRALYDKYYGYHAFESVAATTVLTLEENKGNSRAPSPLTVIGSSATRTLRSRKRWPAHERQRLLSHIEHGAWDNPSNENDEHSDYPSEDGRGLFYGTFLSFAVQSSDCEW